MEPSGLIHHPAILSLPREPVAKPAGFVVDLVGARTRVESYERLPSQGEAPFESTDVVPPLPPFNEAYFEWIDTLEAVGEARGRFVVCELGAGWGRWCVRAVCALRRINPLPFTCIAAEAEPQHYWWMRQHFEDNGIDPETQHLVWAAVAPTSGVIPFWTGDAASWYGQQVSTTAPPPLGSHEQQRLRARGLLGLPPRPGSARTVEWVPSTTLSELLGDEPHVDFLDLDIQGFEQSVLESSAQLIDERVRRIHIGTHSREIEEGLRRLFGRLGWLPRVDYPCQARAETPYGTIAFGDGVQTWLNPRRARVAAARPDGLAHDRVDAVTVTEAPSPPDPRVVELEARVDRLISKMEQLRQGIVERDDKIRRLNDKIQRLDEARKKKP